jgi:hypothetical protein
VQGRPKGEEHRNCQNEGTHENLLKDFVGLWSEHKPFMWARRFNPLFDANDDGFAFARCSSKDARPSFNRSFQ